MKRICRRRSVTRRTAMRCVSSPRRSRDCGGCSGRCATQAACRRTSSGCARGSMPIRSGCRIRWSRRNCRGNRGTACCPDRALPARWGRGLPVALTIASASPSCREHTEAAFHHGAMRIYTGDDVVGVEVGGAVKKRFSPSPPALRTALGLGLNARAALDHRAGWRKCPASGVTLGGRAKHSPDSRGSATWSSTGDRRSVAQPYRRDAACGRAFA